MNKLCEIVKLKVMVIKKIFVNICDTKNYHKKALKHLVDTSNALNLNIFLFPHKKNLDNPFWVGHCLLRVS